MRLLNDALEWLTTTVLLVALLVIIVSGFLTNNRAPVVKPAVAAPVFEFRAMARDLAYIERERDLLRVRWECREILSDGFSAYLGRRSKALTNLRLIGEEQPHRLIEMFETAFSYPTFKEAALAANRSIWDCRREIEAATLAANQSFDWARNGR
ncbi:MAG TPA: hypothetical protein PK205_06995 [Promineifilum sp.]|nr:hypothetical protein [Promineifilum sp.]